MLEDLQAQTAHLITLYSPNGIFSHWDSELSTLREFQDFLNGSTHDSNVHVTIKAYLLRISDYSLATLSDGRVPSGHFKVEDTSSYSAGQRILRTKLKLNSTSLELPEFNFSSQQPLSVTSYHVITGDQHYKHFEIAHLFTCDDIESNNNQGAWKPLDSPSVLERDNATLEKIAHLL